MYLVLTGVFSLYPSRCVFICVRACVCVVVAGLQKPGGPGGLTLDRTGLVDAHRPNEFAHPSYAAARHVQPRLGPFVVVVVVFLQ